MLTQNVGRTDTFFRATLGSAFLVLAALAADGAPWLALVAALVALVALVTAIAGVCPLYARLGLNTAAQTRPRPPIAAKPAPVLR